MTSVGRTEAPPSSWQSRVVVARGEPVYLAMKPGQAGYNSTDYASWLLAEHALVDPGDRVLVLECGSGLAGIVAARAAMADRVVLASPHLVDVMSSRQAVLLAGLDNAEVIHSSGVDLADLDSADVVLARLPKGRLPILRAVLAAYRALRSGGRFYLAGAGDEGIQSSLARVQALFGNAEVVAYKKGCRVGFATKSEPGRELPDEFADPIIRDNEFRRVAVTINRRDFGICSRPGVFSGDGLDPGALALINTMTIDPGDHVLDLGCGSGIVGAVAATRTNPERVCMIDVDSDAIESALETARSNDVGRVSVFASDVVSAIGDRRFDVVVSNPPFHAGHATLYDVAREFIHESAAVLRPGGRAYVVANRFLPYEAAMAEVYRKVDIGFADSKFKVLVGQEAIGRR